MRRNKLVLYLHLVWATWDRLPLITVEIERALYRAIESITQAERCTVIVLNGMPDHVHLLVAFPATATIADLVKQIKGSSPHFVNESLHPPALFRWQGSYGAFTVSGRDLASVADYIKRQKEHHASGDLVSAYESTFDEVPEAQPNLES